MLVELNLVEQRYQAVLEVLNDGASVTDVARRYGVARQTVHEWLRRYAADGLGGLADHSSQAVVVPAPDGPGARGADRGDAPRASGVGAAHDLVLVGPGRGVAVAGTDVGGALSDPSRAGHPAGSEAEAVGLQAVGTLAGDGVVADGHRRRGPHRRRVARRRSCRGSMTTRGSWSRRGWWRGRRRGRCATRSTYAMQAHGVPDADLDRQRQGVHRPVRAGAGAGVVRPDLHRQRDPAHPDGAAVADHDRARSSAGTRRCAASSSTARSSPRSTTRRRSSMRGCGTTTTSGRTSRSVGSAPIERFQLAEPREKPAKPLAEPSARWRRGR